jgi:hypothetical protein
VGEQWQGAGFRSALIVRANVVQQEIHQVRFQFPAGAFGRFFDGTAQFCAGHLADVFLLGRHGLPQPGILCAVGIKIGAQCDADGSTPS